MEPINDRLEPVYDQVEPPNNTSTPARPSVCAWVCTCTTQTGRSYTLSHLNVRESDQGRYMTTTPLPPSVHPFVRGSVHFSPQTYHSIFS